MLDPPGLLGLRLCELPGRSELGLVVANPFGNLDTMSIDYIVKDEMRLTVMGDLLIMLNRHFVVVRSRCRWALWSRSRLIKVAILRFFSSEGPFSVWVTCCGLATCLLLSSTLWQAQFAD